jgi:hypothetical protein
MEPCYQSWITTWELANRLGPNEHGDQFQTIWSTGYAYVAKHITLGTASRHVAPWIMMIEGTMIGPGITPHEETLAFLAYCKSLNL